MDYRKMSGREIMNEYELAGKMLEDDARRGCWIRDGVRKEMDRRDAMLAAAEKMAEALDQLRTAIRDTDSTYMHDSWNEDAHIEDVTVVVKEARMADAALSAYRAAEGGAT